MADQLTPVGIQKLVYELTKDLQCKQWAKKLNLLFNYILNYFFFLRKPSKIFMRHWHDIPPLLFSFQIFMLFSVSGLRKVCSLPNSVHLALGKMNPYIFWLEENRDLLLKYFMTALFRGNQLPKLQNPIGIYHAGSGTGFFMCTSFPNSFSIICT